MKLIHAFILGLVEGVTEFLPVSSTGHLILTAYLLGLTHTPFLKSFEITVQLGAVLALVFLYYEKLLRSPRLWLKVLVAFLPTGAVGFLLYKLIKGYLIGNDAVVVSALIAGGLVLILVDLKLKRYEYEEVEQLPLRKAFFVGLFQSLAVIPGVSRSGASIVGGMLVGLSRKAAADFAFLLAIPTMLAATAYDLYKTGPSFRAEEWELLAAGFFTAFLSGLVVVKWFLNFLKRHGLWVFGVYRIVVGLVYAAFFLRL
ncbi:MAG: undecaprenyl-diphosphate phosphatase [Aquificae bacterium]|nr:undecaprenyl-diphosphate phosphatase [Aquificota bacterium]